MTTRTVTCYIAVCDLCGNTSHYEGFTPHLDTAEEAIQYAVDSGFDERSGWTLTLDGVLVCDQVKDTAHEDAHAAAGKRMSDCAMAVTFPRP
ncbi:hypothetical protein ABZV60_12490 [Streptomyces sp. NPDC004787]|uniref:hypothetical protein n=1 Tax=Streptomyces sp. NPDC004787 TaxID=3154291 RepID=UPI0033AECCA3